MFFGQEAATRQASVQRGRANACFRGSSRRRAERRRSPFAGIRQPPRDQSMPNRAGRDRNPRNAEIGHRAKARNRLHQKRETHLEKPGHFGQDGPDQTRIDRPLHGVPPGGRTPSAERKAAGSQGAGGQAQAVCRDAQAPCAALQGRREERNRLRMRRHRRRSPGGAGPAHQGLGAADQDPPRLPRRLG